VKQTCRWIPANVHGWPGGWDHEYPSKGGMWGSGIKVGQKCYCRKTKWTKEMARRNKEAVDRIVNDPNLNRM
jgi:hypothetical protein